MENPWAVLTDKDTDFVLDIDRAAIREYQQRDKVQAQ